MEFDRIYEAYFKDVYLYILRLSGSEPIAEEITSETFFKAMASIGSFRGECEIRVWLCQIAKNCYFSYLKKQRNLVDLDDAEVQNLADPNGLVEEQVARQEEIRQIRRAMHTLAEPYKEVFMWRVFAELSFKQIGEIFHKTDNWACVTYHRARKLLKDRLEENDREKGMSDRP